MEITQLLARGVEILEWVVITYFIFVNTFYLILLLMAWKELTRQVREIRGETRWRILGSSIAPRISVLAPAFDEAHTIAESARSLLALRYPDLEVVVVNDGSKDETLDVLIREFDLVPVQNVYPQEVPAEPVRAVYRSGIHGNLIVVDKRNGGKADALNAGLNVASGSIVCAIDADTLIEPDALQKMVRPFLSNDDLLAAGGTIRVANGCDVHRGGVEKVRMPRSILAGVQVAEYLRAFLFGRLGWNLLGGNLIVSGAFGLFRREGVIRAGGYLHETVGEDVELVARIRRAARDRGEPDRVEFIPDPVAWTEVPETLRVLGRQRDRWHRGLADTLWRHRRMFLNPRYGVLGFFVYPYFLFVELLTPVVEALGLLGLGVGWAIGILDIQFAILFFLVAYGYGLILTLVSVVMEELAYHRYGTLRDRILLFVYTLFETIGYRQLTVYWRLRGLVRFVLGNREWGRMERKGLVREPEPEERRLRIRVPTRASRGAVGILVLALAGGGVSAVAAPLRAVAPSPAPGATTEAAGAAVAAPTTQVPPCVQAVGPTIEAGWTAYRAGEIAEAGGRFEEVLRSCPGAIDARAGLGYVRMRQSADSAAQALFLEVVAAAPAHVDALVGLGLLAWRAGDLPEVARRFERVLEVDPGNATAADYLGRLPEGLGPPPERPPLARPDTLVYPSRVNGDRFEVRGPEGWEPFYVKGVNLGAALPGRHPSQFPDSATYAGWIEAIGEMGANTLRLYTIHPPDFYEALYAYNTARPDAPIWLVHGVWTELPPDHDYLDPDWEGEFFAEMRRVVDLLHGRADVPPRPGHASGHYTVDLSPWTLAYVIGREWEPYSAARFDALRPDFTEWSGEFLAVRGGNAMDAWLGRACDWIVAYETATYNHQRPVAYTNWPTLDPLQHPTEATDHEEAAIQRAIGEPPRTGLSEFVDDGIGVDASLVSASEAFPAGYFAAFHAYPYYPDFMVLDPGYNRARSSFGRSNYFGYLRDLKARLGRMPVLIAEYGVPASLGIAHLQPQGWHHGGVGEEGMAEIDRRLTLELAEAGMAGGILFAWIDEWFKKNWLVADFELPGERNRLWYNRLDPEQHYGMWALEPRPPFEGATFAERLDEWRAHSDHYRSADGTLVRVAHDAGYLWIEVEGWDREAGPLYVGFDTIDPQRGDRRWPGMDGPPSPFGLEVVLIADSDGVRIVQDPPMRHYRLIPAAPGPPPGGLGTVAVPIEDPPPGTFHTRLVMYRNPPWETVANADGLYDSLVVVPNRRRIGRDTLEYMGIGYDRGVLAEGPPPDGSWERLPEEGAFEARIPWALLGFTDPSSRTLLQGRRGELPATVQVEGVRVAVAMPSADGGWVQLPPTGEAVVSYTWPTWEEPSWRARPRPVYDLMAETFRTLDPYGAAGAAGAAGGDGGDGGDGALELGWPPAPAPAPASLQQVPDTLEQRAAQAWNAGNHEEARRLYGRILEADSTNARALHRLALIAAWATDFDDSLQLFARLLAVDPSNVEARVDRARVLAWSGDLPASLAAFDEILAENPTHARALESQAQILASAGRFEASLQGYDQLLALSPEDPEVRRARARVLSWATRFDEARAAYEAILERTPDDLEARLGLARILSYTGELERSEALYEEILRERPDQAEALRGLARARSWGGKLIQGEEAWRAALERDPDDVAALVGLAANLRWQGRNAAALEALDRAAEVSPNDPDLREQREWAEAALSPRVSASFVTEDDSDDNRMYTTAVSASLNPARRLAIRVDAYRREMEQGPLDRTAEGATVHGTLQLEPGWSLGGGAGGSRTDGSGDDVTWWDLSLATPPRYPLVASVRYGVSALDATAALAETGVEVEEVAASLRWSLGRSWQLDGGVGWATLDGAEENDRRSQRLGLRRSLPGGFGLGVQGRRFTFERDLNDGYFDPDLYWIGEVVASWGWEPGRVGLRLELAPGAQQVGEGEDQSGTARASGRISYRFGPGRELSLAAGYSSTGLQSFSTGDSDYRYSAFILGGSWVF